MPGLTEKSRRFFLHFSRLRLTLVNQHVEWKEGKYVNSLDGWRRRTSKNRQETFNRNLNDQRNGAMLVLSRKKNESIVINNDITIVVVEIRGDKVRLGVEAPKEVPVHQIGRAHV